MTALRRAGLAALLVFAGTAAGDWPGPRVEPTERLAFANACATYENRARFLPRDGDPAFLVLMADGCVAAQESLEDGRAAERGAAATYLRRLVTFRDRVVAANLEQVFGKHHTRVSLPTAPYGKLRDMASLSLSDEISLAYDLGVIAAFESWRARSPDLALAGVISPPKA